MKHELDKMMDLIKDYKTGYGGVTDSFMRKELEMFAEDYHSEQCNIADVSTRTWCVEISQNGWEYTGYANIKCKECKKIGDKKVLADSIEIEFDEEINEPYVC